MVDVVGVRFKSVGKIYYFDPSGLEIKKGDNVIVETARGIEFGNVVLGKKEVKDEEIVREHSNVLPQDIFCSPQDRNNFKSEKINRNNNQ